MSLHSPIQAPPVVCLTETAMAPGGGELRPPEPTVAPSDEQVRAVEAIFESRERESEQVAGLLGLWAGAQLLNDLALETFTPPAGEVEKEEKEKDKDKDKKRS